MRKIRDEAEERVRSMESVKVPKSMFGKSKNLKRWTKKDRMKLRTDE